MAEIKSTLDLVMEKTKHLSLSNKEKEEQKQDEVKKRFKGLVKKFKDNKINLEELRGDLNNLKTFYEISEINFLVTVVFEEFDLDSGNLSLLPLIKDLFGLPVNGLESVLNEYHTSIRVKTRDRLNLIKEDLSKKYDISGSAVVPNLKTDQQWVAETGEITEKFKGMLRSEKESLTGK